MGIDDNKSYLFSKGWPLKRPFVEVFSLLLCYGSFCHSYHLNVLPYKWDDPVTLDDVNKFTPEGYLQHIPGTNDH